MKTNLIQIDNVQLLPRNTMEQTPLLTQVNNLQRLQHFGQLSSGYISIDVQNLSLGSFRQACQNGQCACSDTSFDRFLIDSGDLSDEAVALSVEVLGGEDSGGDGSGTRAEGFEGGNETEVLGEENASCMGEGSRGSDSNT